MITHPARLETLKTVNHTLKQTNDLLYDSLSQALSKMLRSSTDDGGAPGE